MVCTFLILCALHSHSFFLHCSIFISLNIRFIYLIYLHTHTLSLYMYKVIVIRVSHQVVNEGVCVLIVVEDNRPVGFKNLLVTSY